jgi:hypothetical protein
MENTKVSNELNYHAKDESMPSYIYRTIFPWNGGSRNVTLGSNAITQNTIFAIPTEVVNLGESIIEYDEYLEDSGLNNFNWLFDDVDGEFDSILYRDSGSQNIVEMKVFQNYYQKVMNRLTYDKESLEYNDALSGFSMTNAPLTDVASKRFDNTTVPLA